MIETNLRIVQDDEREDRCFIFTNPKLDMSFQVAKLISAHIDVFDYQRLTKPMIFFPLFGRPCVGHVLRSTYFMHPSAMPIRIDPPFLINNSFFEQCLGGLIDHFELLNVEGQFQEWFDEIGMKPIGVYDEAQVLTSASDNSNRAEVGNYLQPPEPG